MSNHSSNVSSKSPISEINEMLKHIPPPPEKIPHPPKIILYVSIVQGKKLQSNGCYCYLQIGNKTFETSKADSPNPIWNEQFHFRKIDLSDQLTIKIYDKDSNEINAINFSLVDFNVNEIVDQWYPIGDNVKDSGKIRIAFHLATRYDFAFHNQEIKIETSGDTDN